MTSEDTPITDQLKKLVDDLNLEGRVKEVATAAEQVVLRGLEVTGSYLRDHRGDIEGLIDWAGAAIDRQTSGRYAGQVEQVRGHLTSGLAGLTNLAGRPWPTAERPEPADPPPPTDAPVLPPEDLPTPPDPNHPDEPGGWAAGTDRL